MSIVSLHIFQNRVFGPENKFSTAKEVDAFFANVSADTLKSWPFDFSASGLKTTYLSAQITPETWRDDPTCIVTAEITGGKGKAIIKQIFRFGLEGNLIIDIDSVKTDKNGAYPQGMRIAHHLSENNLNFIAAYDKKRKSKKPSFLRVNASSGMTKQHVKTCGGYVWANNGFDFSNKNELSMARLAFKKFLYRYNIEISDKKLKLFTKPCHFAAYSSGIFVPVNGKKYRMGKAFLLQFSWQGVLKSSSQKSPEQRYADAYYSEPIPALRRQTALLELSRSYRSFLKDTKKKAILSHIANRFKVLKRAVMIQNAQKHFFSIRLPARL